MNDKKITKEDFERIVNESCACLIVDGEMGKSPEINYWHLIWLNTARFLGVEDSMLPPSEDGPSVESIRQELLNLLTQYGSERIETSIADEAIAKARS